MNALTMAAVGLAAMLGAWSRSLLGTVFNAFYPQIPLGTLAANLVGSFLMGLALVLLVERGLLPPELRAAVITGFLGSFHLLCGSDDAYCTRRIPRRGRLYHTAHRGLDTDGTRRRADYPCH